MSRERDERLSTADLASATDNPQARSESAMQHERREQMMREGAPREDKRREETQRGEMRREEMQREQMRQGTGTADMQRDAAQRAEMRSEVHAAGAGTAAHAQGEREQLAALFDPQLSHDFRMHWTNVQTGFVDDPKRAVQQADELVAQVMKSLAESFARQRAQIEADVGGGDQASTENLRVALRRYRSFFERLLSL